MPWQLTGNQNGSQPTQPPSPGCQKTSQKFSKWVSNQIRVTSCNDCAITAQLKTRQAKHPKMDPNGKRVDIHELWRSIYLSWITSVITQVVHFKLG